VTYYQGIIQARLVRLRRTDIDPRHVEGWMRLEHGTLDALTPRRFAREVQISVDCVDEAGIDRSEELAISYGLTVVS
jgi:hypothetical protein